MTTEEIAELRAMHVPYRPVSFTIADATQICLYCSNLEEGLIVLYPCPIVRLLDEHDHCVAVAEVQHDD